MKEEPTLVVFFSLNFPRNASSFAKSFSLLDMVVLSSTALFWALLLMRATDSFIIELADFLSQTYEKMQVRNKIIICYNELKNSSKYNSIYLDLFELPREGNEDSISALCMLCLPFFAFALFSHNFHFWWFSENSLVLMD